MRLSLTSMVGGMGLDGRHFMKKSMRLMCDSSQVKPTAQRECYFSSLVECEGKETLHIKRV